MDIDLTPEEQEFLDSGHSLWCVDEGDNCCLLGKLKPDGLFYPMGTQPTREEAEFFILRIASMSDNQDQFGIHHSIKRPDNWPEDMFPILGEAFSPDI